VTNPGENIAKKCNSITNAVAANEKLSSVMAIDTLLYRRYKISSDQTKNEENRKE
jgi:hypothetical protein